MSIIQPAASSFTPRKEFLRVPRNTRNTFALLAFSSANCVRLHAFSAQAVLAIRRVLEQYAPILAVCEDGPNGLCEFTVDKKPWANPRSVPSEKLLVDIIRAIYQSGHTYLSTMDYGREPDDRLVMVFSKMEPVAPSVSKSAMPQNPNIVSRLESSTSSLGGDIQNKRVPFAISFPSMTVMRVISPPLHLTPAILQACRGAWPRGVVSEKTVHGNSYEFKLKGYGLFEQDTFTVDSLQHILTLLSSLDAQSFSFIASVSLTNHSRIKDLWLFTAPAPDDIPSDSLEPTSEPLRRFSFPPGHLDPQHNKHTTEPSPAIPPSPLTGNHNKSSSEGSQRRALPSAHQVNVLRKVSPRAQVPVDVRNSEMFDQDGRILNRTYLPSVVPVGAVDMTGVGSSQTPDVFYETSPFSPGSAQHNNLVAPVPEPSNIRRARSSSPRSPRMPVSGRVETPPLLVSAPSTGSKHPLSQMEPATGSHVAEPNSTPPLLGSMVFRDSSMTSDTDLTREIPIKWTGPLDDETKEGIADTRVMSGGWPTYPSPIAEQAEGVDDNERRETPIHENESRVESPEIVQPDVELRKSEAALVGMIKSTSPPLQNKEKEGTPMVAPGSTGKGWVLVNVEDSPPPTAPQSNGGGESRGSPKQTPGASIAEIGEEQHPNPASTEAKAIVVIDVLSSKNKTANTSTEASKEGDSSVKRLFSLARKNSKKDKSSQKA